MKIWQRIILLCIYLTSLFVMLVIPFYRLIDRLFIGQETKPVIAFSIAISIGLVGIVLFKVLKKRYDRRLQSIDVADELGVTGTTPIFLRRALLLLEVAIPLAVISIFFYGIELMQSVDLPSYKIFLDFEYWFIGGIVGLLIHDYLKMFWRKKNAIEKHIKFEEKVEKKKQKIEDKKQKMREKKKFGGGFR